MPMADKNFFITHYEEIETIFNEVQADKSAVYFENNATLVFLNSEKNADVLLDAKEKLQTLCNEYNTVYSIHLSAFVVMGQRLSVPDSTVSFESLNPSVVVPQQDSGYSSLWSETQIPKPDSAPENPNSNKKNSNS